MMKYRSSNFTGRFWRGYLNDNQAFKTALVRLLGLYQLYKPGYTYSEYKNSRV